MLLNTTRIVLYDTFRIVTMAVGRKNRIKSIIMETKAIRDHIVHAARSFSGRDFFYWKGYKIGIVILHFNLN